MPSSRASSGSSMTWVSYNRTSRGWATRWPTDTSRWVMSARKASWRFVSVPVGTNFNATVLGPSAAGGSSWCRSAAYTVLQLPLASGFVTCHGPTR
ncbi:MAG: hypothetical protein QOH97_3503 [Actinoplanes sp.]|nr:hypothetical protein [Actinoplanes sp.]